MTHSHSAPCRPSPGGRHPDGRRGHPDGRYGVLGPRASNTAHHDGAGRTGGADGRASTTRSPGSNSNDAVLAGADHFAAYRDPRWPRDLMPHGRHRVGVQHRAASAGAGMSIQSVRFFVITALLACIVALVAASLFLPVTALQVEVVDVALGAMLGSLATAAGFYFRS